MQNYFHKLLVCFQNCQKFTNLVLKKKSDFDNFHISNVFFHSFLFVSQLTINMFSHSFSFLKLLLSPGGCSWWGQRGDFKRKREADDFHNRVSNLPTPPNWHPADVQGEVPDQVEHPGKHFWGCRGVAEKTRGGESESARPNKLWADTLVRLPSSGSNVWRRRRSHRLPGLCHWIRRFTWLQVFLQRSALEIVHAQSFMVLCNWAFCLTESAIILRELSFFF